MTRISSDEFTPPRGVFFSYIPHRGVNSKKLVMSPNAHACKGYIPQRARGIPLKGNTGRSNKSLLPEIHPLLTVGISGSPEKKRKMRMRLRLSDMTPEFRARVELALARQTAVGSGSRQGQETSVRNAPDASETSPRAKTPPSPTERKGDGTPRNVKAPNKTEASYNRLHLGGTGLYEAITLRLPGGSRYTPDWVKFSVCPDSGIPMVELHEVKGSYRFGSQGRALTAFREAVAAFPCFTFIWAKRGKDGKWEIKRYGGQHGVSSVPAKR